MMIKRISIFSLIFIIVAGIGLAYSAQPVSLKNLIEEALQNNPQIQAAKFRYEAARARISLLRSLDDPKFEYEYDKITADMDAVMNGKTGPMRTFSISQEIPFPTKLILRKQSAQKEASAFEQDYKETQFKVIKDVKDAYFQLFLSGKKISLTKENLNLLSQLVETINKKYSVNLASQQDALKAQVEHSKLSNQLVLLEQEEKIYQAMLNSLLNRQVQEELIPVQEKDKADLQLVEEKVLQLTKENRPELKSFKEMLRKSEIDFALSKQEYLPDVMLKYKREESGGRLPSGSWAGSVGFTIPLWFWDKQNSFVKEAKADLEQARAQYKAEENAVVFESKSAYAKFEAAKKLVKIYETGVLPQAQAAVEAAQKAYAAKSIDFLDLLDTLRSEREFQMEYFEALANLEIALADLERSAGTYLL